MVHLLRICQLFRGYVLRCAERHFRLRQIRVLRPPARHFGKAEIGDLHPAFSVDQNIARFDVAMDDAFLMSVLQRVADFRHDGQRLFGRQGLPGLLHLPQIQAIHVFHDEVVEVSGLSEIVYPHNIRVIQPRQRPGFASEPFGECRVAAQLG